MTMHSRSWCAVLGTAWLLWARGTQAFCLPTRNGRPVTSLLRIGGSSFSDKYSLESSEKPTPPATASTKHPSLQGPVSIGKGAFLMGLLRKVRKWVSGRIKSQQRYGQNMDQNALMESDKLVAVDGKDVLIPEVDLSKRQGHTFNRETPKAALHRAFSFFLFDKSGRMLLTQRAGSKITFPDVWTNTCCSHPLYGMTPDEVDEVPAAYPAFPGIKHAAIRKLQHELGIQPSYIDHGKIKFISRFHYWAADTITYGKDAPWGEHEVDYVLFLQSMEDVPVQANPDEVSQYKYVSIDELKEMLKDPALLWSPWFRGMLNRGIFDWWGDLEGALSGKYTNEDVVFFDPPEEHYASYNK